MTISSISETQMVSHFSKDLICLFSNEKEITHLKIYLPLQFHFHFYNQNWSNKYCIWNCYRI